MSRAPRHPTSWSDVVDGQRTRTHRARCIDAVVQHEDNTVLAGLEDEDVLVLGFFVMEDLIDFESQGLAGPEVGILGEPAIWLAGEPVSTKSK